MIWRRVVPAAAAAALLIAAVWTVSVLHSGMGPAESLPRARASALYREGLDRHARLDLRGRGRLMRAAWEADPTYFPATVALLSRREFFLDPRARETAEALAEKLPDPRSGACICALVAAGDGLWEPLPLPERTATHTDLCVAYLHLYYRPLSSRPGWTEQAVVLARSLAQQYPESYEVAILLLSALQTAGKWKAMADVATEMTERRHHPLTRALGYGWGVVALHVIGGHEAAFAVERRADAFTRNSPPGVRLEYLYWADHRRLLSVATSDSSIARHVRKTVQRRREEIRRIVGRGDLLTQTWWRMMEARRLLDSGDLLASLGQWNDLVAVADSLGVPELQAQVYARRGRTFVKLGRRAEAEGDLIAAREYAERSGSVDWGLEAEHNLLHLYEAAGRFEEARRAGEAFVALTRLGGLRALRMMSYHDLGSFLRRRGDWEAARHMFEAMLADLDALGDPGYYYWAGEYYELIGDLDRAAEYYRLAATGATSPSRALGGLARVAETMGDVGLAIRYARLHDQRWVRNYPENAPLLPGVLARNGRTGEAIVELGRARTSAADRGQVVAWGRVTLELAELYLSAGALYAGAALADSAVVAADRAGFSDLALRGRAVAGLARVRAGGYGAETAMAQVEDAVRGAGALLNPRLEADLNVMYGEGLAALDRLDPALSAFGRAADLAESLAGSLANDPARAGLRAAWLRISNRALAAILQRADEPGSVARYAAWSARRKSRGILYDVGSPLQRRSLAAFMAARDPLSQLQQSLNDEQVLVDYVVLDTAVAALVVTRRSARIFRLPVRADSLLERVRSFRAQLAPRLGRFVDVSCHARPSASLWPRGCTPSCSRPSSLRWVAAPEYRWCPMARSIFFRSTHWSCPGPMAQTHARLTMPCFFSTATRSV